MKQEKMILDELRAFGAQGLDNRQVDLIRSLAYKVRRDLLEMVHRAGSGHLGGALSSLDVYLMLWLTARVTPQTQSDCNRDYIVASHGHTAAGIYSVLGNMGFFDIERAKAEFRKAESLFEGHPSVAVPGVEWGCGSLGQGLSVGCGFALGARLLKRSSHVFVVMGDGEQQKGQVTEASEFAAKYRLGNLTAVVDHNGLQATGPIRDIMPQNIAAKFEATGWKVLFAHGHDYRQLYQVLRECYQDDSRPAIVLAKTIMGKGVTAIEDQSEYHGKILDDTEYQKALADLCVARDFAWSPPLTDGLACPEKTEDEPTEMKVLTGNSITYDAGKLVACRTACGQTLNDILTVNSKCEGPPIAVVDCDLASSVKVDKAGRSFPHCLIECGIQEHNAATVAGALSRSGVLTFFFEFGVFGLDETFGQHRLNDINHTSLKLICTHCGLDVGQDGKTHQCIDYISLASNLFNYKIIIPADANQTDRVMRFVSTAPGNYVIALGRSKVPVLSNEAGGPAFGSDYVFEYGKSDWVRSGDDGVIITCGHMVFRAVRAHEILKEKGISIGVLNLPCPLELDEDNVNQAVATGMVLTYEDHNVRNGLGSMVANHLATRNLRCRFRKIGIGKYGISASPEEQLRAQSMDVDSLVTATEGLLKHPADLQPKKGLSHVQN
jgi:transketolase